MSSNVIPRIWVISKRVAKAFIAGAKVFKIDAYLFLIAIGAVVYWMFNPSVWMEGAVAILIAYTFREVIVKNAMRNRIIELEEQLK